MKPYALVTLTALISAIPASAATSSLFVKDGQELIDVQTLINEETDVYSTYGFDKFCYEGNSQAVITKMKKWVSTGFFFSGGGGGFAFKGLTLIRGFVSYDLQLVLEDEVVPGEFKSVMIKPCSFKK